MPKKNYYRILGVSRNADLNTIKKRFRELAKKYHPDKTSGHAEHTEKFKQVSEAYEVLRDEEKRAAHDRELNRQERGPQRSGFGVSYRSVHDPFHRISSLIDEFFGASPFGGVSTTGVEELELDLTLTPEEARRGGEVSLNLPARPCRRCGGRGARFGRVCTLCRGSGRSPDMSVRIPIPAAVPSGSRERYRFVAPGGESIIVNVTYWIRSH